MKTRRVQRAAALIFGTAIAISGARAASYPPAELVRLENPARGAIVRHEVEASLDPGTHRLEAVDRMTVLHAAGTPGQQAFPFLLWSGCAITSMEAEGARLEFEAVERMNPRSFWRRPPYEELGGYEQARHYEIRLSDIASWPETLRIRVRYAGVVYDSLRAPQVAYARSFETTSGLIDARGAFLSGGTFWIPSRPDEVFTFSCAATVPGDWRAVCQGALVSSASGAGHIDTWESAQPMEEIYLVAGPWVLHEREHRGVRVQAFTYADTDSALYTRYLDGTGRYLDLYGDRIGPYPFAKFALVENFWQTGFGMPSFTLLGDRVIRLPFILDTSYGHEILHNWWGNGVFVDVSGGNWCEGLTTYGADYLYKERESSAAARQYRMNTLAGYLDYVSGTEEIPLRAFRERHDFATQAIGYGKSMMVFHQLRREVGEERFWASLREFYAAHLWRRASWSDLFGVFETVAGVDAAALHHQWIERSGAPRIEVAASSSRSARGRWRGLTWWKRSPESFEIQAVLRQFLPDGSQTGEPYRLTVPVRLQWEDRDSTWQVPLNDWSSAWRVTVDRLPRRILVDPDFEVLRRIHRSEIPSALSRVLGSDTVSVVIAAGLPPEEEAAYRTLAREWGNGQNLRFFSEAEQLPGWTPPGNAWYLGLGRRARGLAAGLKEVRRDGDAGSQGWTIAGTNFEPGVSVVLTGVETGGAGAGGTQERAWAIITAAGADQIPVVGAKVPHYGKYSYLVFEQGKNVGQGVWSETSSPLVIDLAL